MKKILLAILLIMNISCDKQGSQKTAYDSLMELASSRRSIRRYTDRKISRETLDRILTVAATAPSSYGQNPVEFFVVEDKEDLSRLAECKAMGAPSVRNATTAVVIAADTTKGELWVEDTSVAAAYLMLAAEAEGIGACWNQIHLRDGRRSSAGREICELLGIPSSYGICCVMAMGYPAENKPPRSPEKMRAGRIHYVTE